MKKYFLVAAATFSLASAQAALVGRDLSGNAVAGNDVNSVFLYDDVLNVTWLRNANNGPMTWTEANVWAANLVVGAYDDWRLPRMSTTPNETFSYAGGTDNGYNVRTKSGIATQYEAGQTVYSEMAHLWYSTLGNLAYCPPGNASCTGAGTPQPGWGLTNSGNFQNLQSAADLYWIGAEFMLPGVDFAWAFELGFGYQSNQLRVFDLNALAVRDGDVAAPAAVPVPAALPLLLSGLAALGVASRRRGRGRLGASVS